MPVADVDQRPRVRQLGVHQKLLGALRRVVVRLARRALDLLDVARLGGGLDVLEVHVRVLRERHVGAQVEVEARRIVRGLEQVDDPRRADLLGVLLGDLHDERQVGLGIRPQELPEALEGPLGGQGAEELDEGLRVEGVGVDDDAADVREVGVVLFFFFLVLCFFLFRGGERKEMDFDRAFLSLAKTREQKSSKPSPLTCSARMYSPAFSASCATLGLS